MPAHLQRKVALPRNFHTWHNITDNQAVSLNSSLVLKNIQRVNISVKGAPPYSKEMVEPNPFEFRSQWPWWPGLQVTGDGRLVKTQKPSFKLLGLYSGWCRIWSKGYLYMNNFSINLNEYALVNYYISLWTLFLIWLTPFLCIATPFPIIMRFMLWVVILIYGFVSDIRKDRTVLYQLQSLMFASTDTPLWR